MKISISCTKLANVPSSYSFQLNEFNHFIRVLLARCNIKPSFARNYSLFDHREQPISTFINPISTESIHPVVYEIFIPFPCSSPRSQFNETLDSPMWGKLGTIHFPSAASWASVMNPGNKIVPIVPMATCKKYRAVLFPLLSFSQRTHFLSS